MTLDRAARALSVVAISGWLASLILPALSFRFDGEHEQVLEGYKVLTSGYFHLLVLEFSWLANFTFWFVVWLLWTRPEPTQTLRLVALVTLVLAAQSAEIFIFDRFFQYPKAFAGYYVWLVSIIGLAAAAIALSRRDTRTA